MSKLEEHRLSSPWAVGLLLETMGSEILVRYVYHAKAIQQGLDRSRVSCWTAVSYSDPACSEALG